MRLIIFYFWTIWPLSSPQEVNFVKIKKKLRYELVLGSSCLVVPIKLVGSKWQSIKPNKHSFVLDPSAVPIFFMILVQSHALYRATHKKRYPKKEFKTFSES